MNKAARSYCLFLEDGRPAAFAGLLYRPHPHTVKRAIWGVSRLVTLPDFQGLGLAMILADHLGGAYKAVGRTLRTYPAHPALIRSFDKSPEWKLIKRAGTFYAAQGGGSRAGRTDKSAGVFAGNKKQREPGDMKMPSGMPVGQRPNAIFEYCGKRGDVDQARALLGLDK